MPSPPKIRRYIPADRDATLAIWLEASRVGHGFLGEAELQKQKALVRDHYLDASETWLALDGDTPLGFIGLLDAFIGGLLAEMSRLNLDLQQALADEHIAALLRHAAAVGAITTLQRGAINSMPDREQLHAFHAQNAQGGTSTPTHR